MVIRSDGQGGRSATSPGEFALLQPSSGLTGIVASSLKLSFVVPLRP